MRNGSSAGTAPCAMSAHAWPEASTARPRRSRAPIISPPPPPSRSPARCRAPDRLGEGRAAQAAWAALVEDRIVVGLGQRREHFEVGLDRAAIAGERLLE